MGYGQNLGETRDVGAELDLSPQRSHSPDRFCAASAVTLIGISIDRQSLPTSYRVSLMNRVGIWVMNGEGRYRESGDGGTRKRDRDRKVGWCHKGYVTGDTIGVPY